MQITEDQARERLRAKIGYGRKIKDLADEMGVSNSFMSAVLKGDKPITEPMLEAIGVERQTIYVTKE
jgi:plasmid maintenance system antidote protein VapI